MNFDMAIAYMAMCEDMVKWLKHQPLEPCDCEKGEILKSKLEEIKDGLDEVLAKI